jgi:uncharacterized membrane protein
MIGSSCADRPQRRLRHWLDQMKRLLNFARTTLVGGVLFLVPLVVLVAIVGKALELVHKLTDPLAARFPVAAGHTPVLLAAGLLIVVCFMMGLVALTRPARQGVAWLERIFLSKIPGYVFLKGAGESALGLENAAPYPLLLARIEDAWQFGFLIERLPAGHLAVYVPGAPSPLSGSVYFMSPERVRATNIPVAAALKCLRQLGAGSQALLSDPALLRDLEG